MKLQTKVVELFGEVDDNLAQKVHNELHRLDEQPDVRIVLAISSMGGSAKAASEIIESIKAISKPVYGVVIGKAHSAAFFILQNCEERIACNNPHVALMFDPGKM